MSRISLKKWKWLQYKPFYESLSQTRTLRSPISIVLIVYSLLQIGTVNGFAQSALKNRQYSRNKAPITRAVRNYVPDGYQQLGTTDLYYAIKTGAIYVGNVNIGSIDLIGKFGEQYYSSTYSDYGYVVAMKVEGSAAVFADCLTGTTVDGVDFSASIAPQGEMARITYHISNTNSVDKSVSIGAYDDAYVGERINAAINRKKDSQGNTYGISLSDNSGAELCVIFGDGLTGVTGVDDFWFGSYSTNTSAEKMSGDYSSENDYNYMVENGSYDCGIGWCWKNRTVKAGETLNLSYLIAIGDVNLEPSSSFEVTPDDPEGWNDLSRPHKLALQGEYESPAGLDGKIEYAVEDSEDWIALTEMMSSGSTFSDTLVVQFTPNREKHTIRFRTVDNVGNTTMLQPIEYLDVSFHELSGIQDLTYTSDSLYQTNLTCDLDTSYYKIKNYRNNVNAGTASFSMEGVFPYTIGRRGYNFNISPAPLESELILSNDNFVYTGEPFTPEWSFSNTAYKGLIVDKDYAFEYKNNILPGYGTIEVRGMGNYTGMLSSSFVIDKAPLTEEHYTITLPNEDISYDELAHEAFFTAIEGVGEATFIYTNRGENTPLPTAPMNVGEYDIYLEISDGTLYYGKEKAFLGTFAIYQFDEAEWISLQTLCVELIQYGWNEPWDISLGAKAVGTFRGLKVEQGHVVGFDLAGQNLTGTFPESMLAFPNLTSINLSENHLAGDLPMILSACVTENPAQTANITTLNISNNHYSGNVGILAQCFPLLTSLDCSYNCFEDVYPMISPNVTDLKIKSQKMNRVVELDIARATMEDMATKIPSILLYDHEQQSFRTDANILCTTADLDSFDRWANTEWAMQIKYVNGQFYIPYVSSQNEYYGNSGDTVNVMALEQYDELEGSTFRIKFLFDKGDANFINGVEASDLQATILYAFGEYNEYPFNFTAANTYVDNIINVQDVVCTVNILLANAAQPMYVSKNRQKIAQLVHVATDASVYIQDGKVILNTQTPIAVIDIKAEGDINWDVERYGMIQSTKQSNLVAYSLSGTTLPTGETIIGTCSSDTYIKDVSLADCNANTVSVSIGEDLTTSITDVSNSKKDIMIYDISGRKQNGMKKGANILKKNGRIIKVINK